jgi:ribosomal protein S8
LTGFNPRSRDEALYREFTEYKSKHPEFQNLSKEELINKFYYENYRDKIYRMEFLLKFTKRKAVTRQDKIAIPYRYVFASIISLMLFGIGIIILSAVRRKKVKG